METAAYRLLLSLLYPAGVPGFIETRAIASGAVEQHWAQDIDEAIEQAAKRTRTTGDIFFGVNPRSKTQGKSAAVSKIVAVVADVDRVAEDPAGLFVSYGVLPSAIVVSGGGAHAYWALDTPAENTPEFTAERQAFLRLGPSDAVHDSARILRIPGTVNYKYSPPRSCDLSSAYPDRRYPGTIFGKLAQVSEKVRHLLYTGTASGFKSRSERDWIIALDLVGNDFTDTEALAVFAHSPANERYLERWPQLLLYDLERARGALVAIQEAGLGFEEEGNCYWKRLEQGARRKVSTFIFEPVALLQGDASEEDYVVVNVRAEGTGHLWTGVQVPRRAFIDRRTLARHLRIAAWSFLGTDTDAVNLLPHLMRTIQQNKVPVLRAVKALGRHGAVWVTQHNVITQTGSREFADAGIIYLDQGRERPTLKYEFLPQEEYLGLTQRIFELLPQVNRPQVIWPTLGWAFASSYKPLLAAHGRSFPILQIAGTRGAGKTSLLRNIVLPLFGYEPPTCYTCDSTDFVMLSLLSATTTIPVFLTEYRASLASTERLNRRLRLLYDTGMDARGRPDQTTVSYTLTTPICIDGENPIDDPAMHERSVVIIMHPEDLNAERRAAYNGLMQLSLYQFAGPYVQYILRTDPPLQQAVQLARKAFGETVPDRIFDNITRVVLGLLVYQDYADQCKAYSPGIRASFLQEVFDEWLSHILLGTSGRTKVLIDEFAEDLVNQVASGGAGLKVGNQAAGDVRPFIWRYDFSSRELSVHLASALNWWLLLRRQRNLPVLTSSTAKSQLRERLIGAGPTRPGQYVSTIGTKSFGSLGSYQAYTISIPHAKAAGLDVPTSLDSLISIVGSISKEVLS